MQPSAFSNREEIQRREKKSFYCYQKVINIKINENKFVIWLMVDWLVGFIRVVLYIQRGATASLFNFDLLRTITLYTHTYRIESNVKTH